MARGRTGRGTGGDTKGLDVLLKEGDIHTTGRMEGYGQRVASACDLGRSGGGRMKERSPEVSRVRR